MIILFIGWAGVVISGRYFSPQMTSSATFLKYALDTVRLHLRISRYQGERFYLRLRYEQTIKWISMVKRKINYTKQMLLSNRQPLDAVAYHLAVDDINPTL